jgi:hypothetical protein
VRNLDHQKFYDRKTGYCRYNGTKHDGSRRFFGTPNIITYFHISSFIWKNWARFESNFSLSEYSISTPKPMDEDDERSLQIPSLSELSKHVSAKLKYAPFILRADIAQCFPSIYTHSISWAAHGIQESKSDTKVDSSTNTFNALDFFIRNGQQGNTRGVLVGPDAYRIIAEFVLSKIDDDLSKLVGDKIVGAVRHVDDYFVGLRTEHEAESVLSHLREVLASYELNLNDFKTKIHSSLDPINDLWAQRLRVNIYYIGLYSNLRNIEHSISEAVTIAAETKSDSPIKILLRAFDDEEIYKNQNWEFVEPNLQRIAQKHPHAVDYVCLLVAKRYALGKSIDSSGWQSVAEIVVGRALALNHHHEVVWMIWLLLVCKINLSASQLDDLVKSPNAHIRALLIQAIVDGLISRRVRFGLGSRLSTANADWLVNLVARSQGFSKARFSAHYAQEFDHLANKHIKLINFKDHITQIRKAHTSAISRIRYGYDDLSEDDDDLEI